MNNNTKTHIQELVAALPSNPGVYQFIDSKGNVIYVGKAKSLKKRVSSYFVDSRNHSAKVRLMVKKIVDIQHIVVNTEQDALLLENSLIKRLQPRYNILLKDDKTYPWITITKEPFPRVVSTRIVNRDGSEYYGPYGSINLLRELVEFIHEVAPIRICPHHLTEESIKAGKHKMCLQYHLDRCQAPCEGLQSAEEYNTYINHVRSILKGDLRPLKDTLYDEMIKASDELRFEDAGKIYRRIKALNNYQSMSVMVSSKIIDCDVFSTIIDENVAFCNVLRVRRGAIVTLQTIRMDISIEATEEDVLSTAIQHIVDVANEGLAPEVIVPKIPSAAPLFDKVKFIRPKIGEKAKLLNFSLKSAETYRAEYMDELEKHNPDRVANRLMAEMRKELGLDREPRHIECFDNSNLQGTNPVASCVVFRNGRPSTSEYRHYNIKTVIGPDDYATMYEVVYRRYRRLLDEGASLPDLIIVDGGKGQLSRACLALHDLDLYGCIPIISLAERLEEVFYPEDPYPHYLNRLGAPFKTICFIRDEAHRSAIMFHRHKRRLELKGTELNYIFGIGAKTRQLLLTTFKTLSAIKSASFEELSKVVGPSKARKIVDHFAKQQDVDRVYHTIFPVNE
jgi:excinuclease ABC subunit C